VSLKNKETGELRGTVIKTIAPGHQNGLAQTLVGSIDVELSNTSIADPVVTFRLGGGGGG
jgi:hypothetical protein